MNKSIAILPMLVLVGCGSMPEKVRTVTVPVNVPCRIAAPARPLFEFDALPMDAGLDQQVTGLLVEREQRMAYEGELEAAIKSCQ